MSNKKRDKRLREGITKETILKGVQVIFINTDKEEVFRGYYPLQRLTIRDVLEGFEESEEVVEIYANIDEKMVLVYG